MDATALTEWFDERVADHWFSGAALVWRDGGPLYEYAGGLAHRGLGVQITQRTRFAVASVTKMVTATAIMRLVDRGLIGLDQPVTRDRRPPILIQTVRGRLIGTADAPHSGVGCYPGGMLRLYRKTLSGSYRRLMAASRANRSGP